MMLVAVIIAVVCCGQVLAGSRIVGGEDATPGQFPHQCALEFSSGSHTCGCSIISSGWVVSAAHCTQSAPSSYRVVVGQHDRTDNNQIYHTISRIINHGDYGVGPGAFPNDISVLEMFTPIEFGEFAQPINLAEGDNDYAGDRCIISGWGRLFGGGPLPDVLQWTEMNVLSQSECEFFWGSSIIPGHVCIMDSNPEDGMACNGDSGGPLQCEDTLVGLASWVGSGCVTFLPSGYTRISHYRDWIREYTGV